MTVSIRPHTIAVAAGAGAGRRRRPRTAPLNVFTGTVTRAAYFGDAMDYQVAIAGTACTLRAAGAPEPRFAVGQPVVARIEARACIVVR